MKIKEKCIDKKDRRCCYLRGPAAHYKGFCERRSMHVSDLNGCDLASNYEKQKEAFLIERSKGK